MLKGIDNGGKGILVFGAAIAALLLFAFLMRWTSWKLLLLVGTACGIAFASLCRRGFGRM